MKTYNDLKEETLSEAYGSQTLMSVPKYAAKSFTKLPGYKSAIKPTAGFIARQSPGVPGNLARLGALGLLGYGYYRYKKAAAEAERKLRNFQQTMS